MLYIITLPFLVFTFRRSFAIEQYDVSLVISSLIVTPVIFVSESVQSLTTSRR